MSYCRWSSDNFRSDVYVYEDVCGGWTTHVAGRRWSRLIIPGPPWRLLDSLIGRVLFRWWSWLHHLSLQWCPMVDILLPHAGETFNDETPGGCADTLEFLRGLGYVVPKYAIDELREEEKERG